MPKENLNLDFQVVNKQFDELINVSFTTVVICLREMYPFPQGLEPTNDAQILSFQNTAITRGAFYTSPVIHFAKLESTNLSTSVYMPCVFLPCYT